MSGAYLLVSGGVPVGVEQHEAVAAHEVEAAAAGLAAEQEHKLLLLGVVEGHHQLLALADAGGAVQPNKGVLGAQPAHAQGWVWHKKVPMHAWTISAFDALPCGRAQSRKASAQVGA